MKPFIVNKNLSFTLIFLLLIGCSNIIDEKDLVERASIKYLKNNDVPFTGEVVSQFDNGQIQIEGQYNEGKRFGVWIEYYNNGSKKEEGKYKDGLKVEEWLTYFIDGIIKSKGVYISGLKDGLWKYWYNSGKKEKELQFLENREDGRALTWYENEKEKSVSTYSVGVLNGEFLEWDQNGNIISKGIFKTGERWSGYFGDDHYINGKRGSLFVKYFKNGQKKIEGILIDGKKTGPWSEW